MDIEVQNPPPNFYRCEIHFRDFFQRTGLMPNNPHALLGTTNHETLEKMEEWL